jgi:hypothetical protein
MTHRQRKERRERRSVASVRLGLVAGGGIVAATTLLSGSVAEAIPVSVTVNSLSDSSTPTSTIVSHETLADAIEHLDTVPGGGTITFKSGLSGTIHVKPGFSLPGFTEPIEVKGPGASKLTIDGGGKAVGSSIFQVETGLTSPSEISGLTLTHGYGVAGGAVEALSSLSLYLDTIKDNTAVEFGGAVLEENGVLEINASTIENNVGDLGGAVAQFPGTDSSAEGIISNSTLSGNTATGAFGAIFTGVPLDLSASTVAHNISHAAGGGIYSNDGLFIESSTIVDNTNSTTAGGGVVLESTTANFDVVNSIIADNSSKGHGDPDIDNETTHNQFSFSLIGDGADTGTPLVTSNNGDITGSLTKPAQPKLGKLRNNGGPTPTMEPLKNSPVINQGEDFGSGYDQRGYGRPVNLPGYKNAKNDDGSDIGAVELQTKGESFTGFSGNLKLTLSVPLNSCVASFDDLPASFGASVQKHSHATKTKFKSVAFYLDRATHSHQKPNVTSTKSKDKPTLPLFGEPIGQHSITAVATVTHKRGRHTVKSTVTLQAPYNVCFAF